MSFESAFHCEEKDICLSAVSSLETCKNIPDYRGTLVLCGLYGGLAVIVKG